MSRSQPTASRSLPSNFQLIFNNALEAYEKRTKRNLLAHPLAPQLQACDSPGDILAVLQQQVQGLDRSQSADERWTKWLDPTIHVLFTFSQTVVSVGLAFSPATVVFVGISVLLSAAKDVRDSQDTLVDVFGSIEMFFRRLEVYTEAPLTTEMTDIITHIMAEVLSILGIATKEITRSRLKTYGKTLIGRTDMKDALKKLDKLTQEEARMAIAQNLKATHAVDDRVRGVANTMADVNGRVAGIDERIASVARATHVIEDWVRSQEHELVVDDRVASIDDPIAEVINDGNATNQVTNQTANDVDQVNQTKLRENIHKWLSPPDPSTNHKIACDTYNKKTATWFFQGSIFRKWKSTGSLLWIHGKPGSGKSILCSTIVEDIQAQCAAGEASMAYFYFDFRNATKQALHDLVPSLLQQLSAHSSPCCDILSKFYSTHDNGKKQPSDGALTKCLKDMLALAALPDQSPTYLIIDALDESSNTSGIPSARERVLHLLKELVDLRLPNLRICVTSRPEIDIQDVISPLTSLRVSLHDQTGQKNDIAEYVRSIVYSNSEPIIRRWKKEDKDLVVEVLSERVDGMFRWIFCQLEILRQCLPSSVRRFLQQLPESLDETYERMLREIKKPNRDHARRVLQCLAVAIRPLRVEELAEVLAVDFDDAEGIPKLKPNWRWEDQEQALLISCSSLITIVDAGYRSRVVQFSHFSVKEFLTSERLATSSQDLACYHIGLNPAHAILAQACVSVLLQVHDRIEEDNLEDDNFVVVDHEEDDPEEDDLRKKGPLARYAAEYWVRHAQFEDVASRIKGVEYLFDSDKPFFAAWRKLHDIDIHSRDSVFYRFTYWHFDGTPLYYAALCGFRNIVERLIVKHPKDVRAISGNQMTPALAALAGRHFELARVLCRKGSSVNPRDYARNTPLHLAVNPEMAQVLVDFGADVNARNEKGLTPLSFALCGGKYHRSTDPGVVQLVRWLLNHGADPNVRDMIGENSLHIALGYRMIEIARLLVEHGASVKVKNVWGLTPLDHASAAHRGEIRRLYRAKLEREKCCIM